jgi:hypothetical protein
MKAIMLKTCILGLALSAATSWGFEIEEPEPLTLLGADLRADCIITASVAGVLEDSGGMQLVELSDVEEIRCKASVTRAILSNAALSSLATSSDRVLLFLNVIGETGRAIVSPLPPKTTELQVATLYRIWGRQWVDMIEAGNSLGLEAAMDHYERVAEPAEAEVWNAAMVAESEIERFWVARAGTKTIPESEMRSLGVYLLERAQGYLGVYSALQLSLTPAETRADVLVSAMTSNSPLLRQAAYRLAQDFAETLPLLDGILTDAAIQEPDQAAAFELARTCRMAGNIDALKNLSARYSDRRLEGELALALAQRGGGDSLAALEELARDRPAVKEILYQALAAAAPREDDLGESARSLLLSYPLEEDAVLRYAQIVALLSAPSGERKVELLKSAAFDEADAQFPSATRAIEALMMDCSRMSDEVLESLASASPRERHRSLISRVLLAWNEQGTRQCN